MQKSEHLSETIITEADFINLSKNVIAGIQEGKVHEISTHTSEHNDGIYVSIDFRYTIPKDSEFIKNKKPVSRFNIIEKVKDLFNKL